MIKKKFIAYVAGCVVVIVCGLILFKISSYNNHQITLSNIHREVIFGETTTRQLENQFGKPTKIITNKREVIKTYHEWNELEGTTNEFLVEYSNFFKTKKRNKKKVTYPNLRIPASFDTIVEYRNKSLGVEYVKFYVGKGIVYMDCYGDITNEKIARKDKYLRQILEH